MSDATATMGSVLPATATGRDAVHVAVIAAIAGEVLYVGQDVGITPDIDGTPIARSGNPIGIVDPFLKGRVQSGDRFWLFLYPRTITSLRHVWTHPAFADAPAGTAYNRPAEKIASEQWLRDFAKSHDCPRYEDIIAGVAGTYVAGQGYERDGENCSLDSEYFFFVGTDAHDPIPPEFWDHIEVVTGQKIEPNRRARAFSCSC